MGPKLLDLTYQAYNQTNFTEPFLSNPIIRKFTVLNQTYPNLLNLAYQT